MKHRGGKPGHTHIDRRIGFRVRSRRTQLKLSQLQLARRVGLQTAQSVGALEAGKNKFSAERLVRTALALRCSFGWLVGEGEAEQAEQTEADRWWITKPAIELANALVELEQPHRDRIAKRTTVMVRQIKRDVAQSRAEHALAAWVRLLRNVGPDGLERLNRWGAGAIAKGMLREDNAHRAADVLWKWNGDRKQDIVTMLDEEFKEP